MANYGIALGGNKRNFPGWDNMYASANSAGDIKYDGALPTRSWQIGMHFDGVRGDWQSWLKQETPTGTLAVGDTLDFVWINEGTEVHKSVINVRKLALGVTGVFQLFTAAGAPVGAAIPVDFGVLGFVCLVGADKNIAMTENGSLRFTLKTGDLTLTCFDVVTSLTSFKLDETCSCAPPPCAVPTPQPLCFSAV